MPKLFLRKAMFVVISALVTGCQDGASPDITRLELPEPANMRAVVFQSTHESGHFPGGYVSQYAVWIGAPGSTTPGAGLVVGAHTPVFVRSSRGIERVTAAAIMPGDLIEVWRDAFASYGAVQAPPGQPCYYGRQIVIVR